MTDGFKEGYWYRLKRYPINFDVYDYPNGYRRTLKDFKWRRCIEAEEHNGEGWGQFVWIENGQEQHSSIRYEDVEECDPKEILKEIMNDKEQ